MEEGAPYNTVHRDLFRDWEPLDQTDGSECEEQLPEEEDRRDPVLVVVDEVRVGADASHAGVADDDFVGVLQEVDAGDLGVRSEGWRTHVQIKGMI
jgi:hypothetical protein